MRQRLLGLLMLLIGLALAYLCLVEPLVSATQKTDRVSLPLKGIILCPIMLLFGSCYVVLGDRAESILGTRKAPSDASLLLGVLLIAIGVVVYFIAKTLLERLGYFGEP